jgi:hypothetical protein
MMKAWSIMGLVFTAAIIATIPISPQVTPSLGLGLSVDQAQAQVTYGQARRMARRDYRRSYYGFYGAPSSYYGFYGAPSSYYGYYGAPGYYYDSRQPIGGGGGQRYPLW